VRDATYELPTAALNKKGGRKRPLFPTANACARVASITQLVGRRKCSTARDRGRRRGNVSACRRGASACSVTCVVWTGGYIAERRGHFLVADNAGRRACGRASRPTNGCAGDDLCGGRRGRQKQGNDPGYLHVNPELTFPQVRSPAEVSA
jgi:hypothetical protein